MLRETKSAPSSPVVTSSGSLPVLTTPSNSRSRAAADVDAAMAALTHDGQMQVVRRKWLLQGDYLKSCSTPIQLRAMAPPADTPTRREGGTKAHVEHTGFDVKHYQQQLMGVQELSYTPVAAPAPLSAILTFDGVGGEVSAAKSIFG
jgi:hypothetical protein